MALTPKFTGGPVTDRITSGIPRGVGIMGGPTKIAINIDSELDAFAETLKRLGSRRGGLSSKGIYMLMIKMVTRWSEGAADTIKKGYLSTSGGNRPGTQLTYHYGKAAGLVNRHRWTYPDARPGNRSGLLAQSVKLFMRQEHNGWNVEIDPATKYTGFRGKGDPTDAGKDPVAIAAQLENPTPRVVQIDMTRRMQVYLMLLYSGKAGEAHALKKHIPWNPVVGTVVITKRPLPIWRTAYEEMIKKTDTLIEQHVGSGIDELVVETKAASKTRK